MLGCGKERGSADIKLDSLRVPKGAFYEAVKKILCILFLKANNLNQKFVR
ncbi:MAG: hypothetical protein LKE46_08375 [Clostridium sp.]|jgi:hypothetical protein|nr:hypothetical protein [Clostridium sp.]MCH3964282.1 hypothetical protein [Clostridium sp.]MCI1870565.1 hypothetical protein [Clostridium sp.]